MAVGITATGQREVLGIEVGNSETRRSGPPSCGASGSGGLPGIQLVISNAYAGLKKAIARCCQSSSWQRFRVHVARNLLAKVPKGSQDMVAASLRSMFVQAEAQAARCQLRRRRARLSNRRRTPREWSSNVIR